MKKKFGIKIITLFLCVLTLSSAQVFATNTPQSEQAIIKKHQETTAKIKELRFLENRETNKLYTNQKKLETASKDLD